MQSQQVHNELKRGKKSIFGRTMHCLPQRLNAIVFLNFFFNGASPKGTRSEEKISKKFDFSLWGNHATNQMHRYLKLEFFPRFSSLCAYRRHRYIKFLYKANLKDHMSDLHSSFKSELNPTFKVLKVFNALLIINHFVMKLCLCSLEALGQK